MSLNVPNVRTPQDSNVDVSTDQPTTWVNMKDLSDFEKFPGYHGKMIHSERMTFVTWEIEEGAPFPEHKHPHEQITYIIEGELELTVSGETKVVGPGNTVIIPPNALHLGRAITACKIVDVFAPVREDYK